MSATVLAPYPISQAFRRELEERHGAVEVLTISQLRRNDLRSMIALLRRVHGTVVIAAETPAAESTLPALQALASFTRASSLELAAPGHPAVKTSRAGAGAALGGVLAATGLGAFDLVRTDAAAQRLLRTPPRRAAPALERGILMLNASPWVGLSAGGAVSHTVGIANALAAAGIDVTVASFAETPGLDDAVAEERLVPPRGYAFPAELNRFRFARAAAAIRASPGVVYERASLGSTAGVALSRRLRVPLVLEYNGSEIWAARNWGGTTRLEGAAVRAEAATLRHAQLVVTVSEVLADELAGRGVDAARIVWHPNGVDAARFDPASLAAERLVGLRSRYGIPTEAVVATFVGTFGDWHGADVLARAAQLARGRTARPPLHFLFVGDGPRGTTVRELLDGSDNATLAGVVPASEIPLHLAASDILVSPHVPNPDGSVFFGSPTKLFEYMAAGRAIVASDLGQIGDVLRDGAGILVRAGDEVDLLRGLDEAAGDPARRAELGARARQRVLDRYTWEHHARAIVEAIRRS